MHFEWLSDLWLRCRALLERRRLHRDLEEEIRFHLDQRVDSYRQQGMDFDEAARLSRRQFGSPTAWKEVCRDMWTFRWLEVVSQDLRYAARMLRRSPALRSW